MRFDETIQQASPNNILWRLFRMDAERQELPEELSARILQLLQDVEKRNEFQPYGKRGQDNEE